jgi:hypothetical protein
MPHEKSFWYKVGFALERARQAPASGSRVLASLKDRRASAADASARERKPTPRVPHPESWPTGDELVASAMTALAARVLSAWRPRRRTTFTHLVRGVASGAAAAFLVEFLRPMVSGRVEAPTVDRKLADRLLLGAGQGLVYGGVLEPRIPGPAVVKGAVYGSAEYAVDPMGGLSHLLGAHAPQGRFPAVAHLLEDLDGHDRAYVEHVVFGMTLALLYGSSPSNNGIRVDADDQE